MNKKSINKIGIISLSIIVSIYLLFLILPFILSPVLNGYSGQISKMVEEASGFKVKLDDMRIITTPKLTVGLKINKTEAFLPSNEKFLQIDNVQVKLSLLPILLKKIELDIVSADNINIDLKVQKDGKFLIENYLPETQEPAKKPEPIKPFFKLSNHLPNISIDKHNITFIDMATNKKYSILGDKTKITDFVLDKKIKISGSGKMVLDGKEQFSYDTKILNEIMPNLQLNDLVFNPQPQETKPQEIKINIIDIFEAIHNNQFSANLKNDIKISGKVDDVKVDGKISVDKLSVAVNKNKLPDSNILLNLKGNKIRVDSDLHTAQNEITHLIGTITTGKKPNIDMRVKSNVNLKSVLEIAKSVTNSFGINDLQTLSANGVVDADFNIKSNLKNIQSSGYFKIPNANLNYGLYKVAINQIHSDISLDNNLINIKDMGFYVLGHPLKIYGTIKQDASANINVVANQLPLKSILLSLGQVQALKENIFNSGTLTLNTSLTGKLNNPNTLVNLSVDNLNLKNVPSNSTVIMQNSTIKLKSDKKSFTGTSTKSSTKIINPAAVVSIGKSTAVITPTEIIMNPTSVSVDKINLIVSGKIQNYLSEKIVVDINTSGDIKSTLKGDMNAKTQKLNLNYSIPNACTIPIPGLANSKLQAKGNVAILGPVANPKLKGTFSVPFILLPDMLVSMSDMVVSLNGPIAKGSGTVKKITSGGVVAQNLSANFILKGDMFSLTNIIGDAYDGKIKGSVDYNIINGKTAADIKGAYMDANKTITGAAGIKNALSGTLGFDTKVTLQGISYEDMVKSLKGDFSFNVTDGALGKVGRLDNFLNAQNILANSVMRLALNSITQLATVKDTANFKYIKGDITFSNGWANISSIKTSGPAMAYFVKGRYNILNGSTNVIILGRLSSDVVALLGPIGDLSVDKLTSYIPKFGPLTAIIIKSMTTNPAEKNISNIPPLSGTAKTNKDFKVVFNGGIESQSSVKSFKWLSDVDTSAFDLKSTVGNVKKQFTDVKNSTVNEVKKQYSDVKNSAVSGVKGTVDETKKQLETTRDEVLNLFKF